MARRKATNRTTEEWWLKRTVTWTITLKDGSRRACAVPLGVLVDLMDTDIAKQIQFLSHGLTPQEILDQYMELHRNKHGQDFLTDIDDDERQNIVLCKTKTEDGCIVARPVPTKVAIELMDFKLFKQVKNELMPCMPQRFMDRYMELHREKYGVEFLTQQFADAWGNVRE